MSKAGERLLQGAREALEFANGTANPDLYRVHHADVGDKNDTKENLSSGADLAHSTTNTSLMTEPKIERPERT